MGDAGVTGQHQGVKRHNVYLGVGKPSDANLLAWDRLESANIAKQLALAHEARQIFSSFHSL